MEPPADGCPLCGSTWGDWWEEVNGVSTFFCCELCARMWRTIHTEVQTRTGWPKVDAVEVEGNRWGRTGRARAGDAEYDFYVVFTPEGHLRRFEPRPSRAKGTSPPTVAAAEVGPAPPAATASEPAPESFVESATETEIAPPAAEEVEPEEALAATGMDPALKERLADEALRFPNLLDLSVPEARKVVREMVRETDRLAGAPAAVSQLRNTSFSSEGHRVPVRVYTPVNGTRPLPVVLYFHGGGWVYGDLDTHDSVCREIADRSHCLVAAVAYRRSPESKFPAAVEDAFAALRWVNEPDTIARLEIDPTRVVVAGDSAGGTIATAVALRAKAAGGPMLAGQILICPVIDREPSTPSYQENAVGTGLEPAFLHWMWEQYLARPEDGNDPLAVPARATDLRGLPPALILTAECDVLRDEAERYADRLAEAEVKVQSTRYAGMVHGFIDYRGIVEEGWSALEEIGAWLQATVHSDAPPPPPPPPPPAP